jgi:hypothetical protein
MKTTSVTRHKGIDKGVYKNGTEIVYICTKCGDWYIAYYIHTLVPADFIGTPIGEMLERYNETSPTDSNDNSSDSNQD